jgi:hypothetical protein
MSWFRLLPPLILLSACGGSVDTPDGDGGAGGTASGGAGGAKATGGTASGGAGGSKATGGVGNGGAGGSKATGGVGNGGAGGSKATGGTPGTGGVGPREPVNHRVTEVTCGARPADAGDIPSSPMIGQCQTDAQCTSGLNGRCVRGLFCSYDTCFENDDCAAGSTCLCGSSSWVGNECSQAGCRVDADCPGSWCSPTFGSCGNYAGVVGYACHTPKDECVDDVDCENGPGGYCWYSPMVAHWLCSTAQCGS